MSLDKQEVAIYMYKTFVSTPQCAPENEADLYVNESQKIRHHHAKSIEERRRKEKEEECQITIFYIARCVRKLAEISN